jgi:hypothetical protein
MHCSPTKSIKRGLIKRFSVLSPREQTLNVANGQQTVTGEHKLDILRDTFKWKVHTIRLLQ